MSDDVEAAWHAEIARRLDDVETGRVKTLSMAEFKARLAAQKGARMADVHIVVDGLKICGGAAGEAAQVPATRGREATCPRCREVYDALHALDDMDDDPRAEKPWPPEEDCKGCPARVTGPHKLSCPYGGAGQMRFTAKLKE